MVRTFGSEHAFSVDQTGSEADVNAAWFWSFKRSEGLEVGVLVNGSTEKAPVLSKVRQALPSPRFGARSHQC